MNAERLFSRIVPALCAGALLLAGAAVFTARYTGSGVSLPLFFDIMPDGNRNLFYINFYVPWTVCVLALYSCFFSCSPSGSGGGMPQSGQPAAEHTGFVLRGVLIILALAAVLIAAHVLNDILTIKFCLYGAFVIIASSSFTLVPAVCAAMGAAAIFCFLSFHPAFLGDALGPLSFPDPSLTEVLLLFLYLNILVVLSVSIRVLTEKCKNSEAAVKHLNLVGTRMLLFNHRLQEHVKNSGEEAIKKDRLRFTSDLHDSCGYVFTNIIAISNAAMSQEHTEEKIWDTFHMIRSQAQEGLSRTREILHMIREIQDPFSRGIDAIYQMKRIFEDVTGIRVEIETGNMRSDYGPTVNSVLSRIIQESFTNAVRHGNATRIGVQFWEFPQSLTMMVSDNGKGATQIIKGIGMAGMEERVMAAGGTLQAYSPENGGFHLKVEIPLVSPEPVSGRARTGGAGP